MKILFLSFRNIVVIIITVFLFAITGFIIYNFGENNVAETFSIPLSNKIILIDPGHGGVVLTRITIWYSKKLLG